MATRVMRIAPKGVFGGLAIAALMLFANWPQALTLGAVVTAAGFPFTFAVWTGAKLDSFRISFLLLDVFIAISLIALTAVLLSLKRNA